MSNIQQFRGAVRRFRNAFEYSHLYYGSRVMEQIRAEQADYEIRLRDLREREAAAETYAQAMARLTGADLESQGREPGDMPEHDMDNWHDQVDNWQENYEAGGQPGSADEQIWHTAWDGRKFHGTYQTLAEIKGTGAERHEPGDGPGEWWAGPTGEYPTVQAWPDAHPEQVVTPLPTIPGPGGFDYGAWPDNEYAAEDAYEADHKHAAQINAKADELRRAHRLAVYAEEEYGRKSTEAVKADMALNDVTFSASSAALHAYAQMANADAVGGEARRRPRGERACLGASVPEEEEGHALAAEPDLEAGA